MERGISFSEVRDYDYTGPRVDTYIRHKHGVPVDPGKGKLWARVNDDDTVSLVAISKDWYGCGEALPIVDTRSTPVGTAPSSTAWIKEWVDELLDG